jgi:hypothetical protein
MEKSRIKLLRSSVSFQVEKSDDEKKFHFRLLLLFFQNKNKTLADNKSHTASNW